MSHMHKLSLLTAACAIALPMSAFAHGAIGSHGGFGARGGGGGVAGSAMSISHGNAGGMNNVRIIDPSGHMAYASSPATRLPITVAPNRGLSESLARAPQSPAQQSVSSAPRTIARAIQPGKRDRLSAVPRSVTHAPQHSNSISAASRIPSHPRHFASSEGVGGAQGKSVRPQTGNARSQQY